MTKEEFLLGLLLSGMTAWVIALVAVNALRKDVRRMYGLPRCSVCRRVWDEHTNIGACPDGSGRFYED